VSLNHDRRSHRASSATADGRPFAHAGEWSNPLAASPLRNSVHLAAAVSLCRVEVSYRAPSPKTKFSPPATFMSSPAEQAEAGNEMQGARADQGEDSRVSLVAAVLVGQFEFLEWTGENHLRHTKFIGLRVDKPARRSGARQDSLSVAAIALCPG
jgi:hypothetical protein